MIGAIKGYRVELVVPANISEERKKTLLAYGARLIYTDPLLGSDGALLEARRRYEENPDWYFKGDQYNNAANWRAHYETTGVEIFYQSRGKVTHFVAGVGTGGTLMGTGRRLKDYNSHIRVYGVQPDNGFHGIEGLKHIETAIRPGIYDDSILRRHSLLKPKTPTNGESLTRERAPRRPIFWSSPVGFVEIGGIDWEWNDCDDLPGWRDWYFSRACMAYSRFLSG
jgi:cysteine synthase